MSIATFTPADLISHPAFVPDASELVGRRAAAVPVSALVEPDAVRRTPWVSVDSSDGYRASIPTDELRRGGYILVPTPDLPGDARGDGTFRLVVADGSTLCWNVKHVTSLRATAEREPDSVPENPPH